MPDGSDESRTIPKSFLKGFVLHLSKNTSNEIEVTIRTNDETFQEVSDHDLTLSISLQGIVFKTVTFRMNSVDSYLNLFTSDLPDGIVMLTLTDHSNKPLCERLVYIQNGEDLMLSMETNKSLYDRRDSVSVRLTLPDTSYVPPVIFLSLSAVDKVAENNTSRFPSTICSWFLLESEIRGDVEEPSYYFNQSNPYRLGDLDLLLLTQGWRDFEWKYNNMNYLPEYGFTISGKIRKKFADIPVKNASVNIGIFGSGKPFFNLVLADSAGRFCLRGIDLTGTAKLIASVTGEKDKLGGWLLLDSLRYSPAEISGYLAGNKLIKNENQLLGESLLHKNLYTYIQYSEIKRSMRIKYKLSDTINVGEVTIIAKRQPKPESALTRSQHYLRTLWPDRSYVVAPESKVYTNVGNLLQYRFNIKPASFPKHRPDVSNNTKDAKGNSKSASGGSEMAAVATGQNGNNSSTFNRQPIILLNGMEVGWAGVDYLPINWVDRVDYILPRNAELTWGVRGMNGVVSVVTSAPVDEIYQVFHSVNIRFMGYNEPRIFYSAKHHTTLDSDYKPDLRTTLFWEPDIIMRDGKDVDLKYYNADNPGIISIKAEGMTSSGIPVSCRMEYQVK